MMTSLQMLLLHGDCLEVMKTLPDRSIDLFVCDLPYGCLQSPKGNPGHKKAAANGGQMNGCAWDIKIDLVAFWVQVKRLCKNEHTPVVMFCSTKFGHDLITSNPDWFRYDLVWSKTNAVGFLQANRMPMRSHEMIYVFAKRGATYYRKDVTGGATHSSTYNTTRDNEGIRCVKSVITCSNPKGKGKHPTQKPVELYEWLLERYSKEGDTVLDPTAGSFTSVFTAERLGRTGIGIEQDEGFYQKALTDSSKK